MLKVGEILTAVKTVLDADSTLDTLLGVTEGISKIIKGAELPSGASAPCVNLVDLTENTVDADTKLKAFILAVVVRANTTEYGLIDYDALDDIGNRIYTLLEDQKINLPTAHQLCLYYENALTASLDIDMQDVSIKQYRYRILVI